MSERLKNTKIRIFIYAMTIAIFLSIAYAIFNFAGTMSPKDATYLEYESWVESQIKFIVTVNGTRYDCVDMREETHFFYNEYVLTLSDGSEVRFNEDVYLKYVKIGLPT